MPAKPKIAAIILAAGYSSRMKEWKPLLPLGNTSVVGHVISTFQKAGVADIVVVAGHRAPELAAAIQSKSVRCVVNERYDKGMYESVVIGVRALPEDTEAFFLLPVDVPLVKCHSIRLLARHFAAGAGGIIYPVFRGQRGHPPLISTRFAPLILAGAPPGGLGTLLEEHEESAQEVVLLDEGILMGMNTQEDYRRIQERLRDQTTPSPDECAAILAQAGTPEVVVKHGRQVASLAGKISAQLNQAGMLLDTRLLQTAALLHDLAKGRKNHAQVGCRLLQSMGYPQVANIVKRHMDMEFDAESTLDEAGVLYLADKLVSQDRLVSLSDRFISASKRYPEAHPAQPFIRHRLDTANRIASVVEGIIGQPLDRIMGKLGANY